MHLGCLIAYSKCLFVFAGTLDKLNSKGLFILEQVGCTMTNEEIEKTMQFILEQQAQFASKQQQMLEQQAQYESTRQFVLEQQAQSASTQQFILEQQAQYASQQQQLDERVTRLETSMEEMARAQAHMSGVVASLADAQRHTEEKLEAFIGVLERYISEDRNGKSNGESAT